MLGHRKLNVEDYAAILKRRRWLILVPLVALPLFSYALSFLIPSEFMSSSLVLVEEKKVPDKLVESIISQGLSTRLAAMRETALSRSRLEPIIQHYNLFPSKHLTMDDRIEQTRKAIAILPIKSEMNKMNGLPGFTIAFKGDDPHTAQQVCSDVTGLFISQNLQNRQNAANETTDFLKKQLDDAKAALDDQDKKLAEFQGQHIGSLAGTGVETTGNMLGSLSTQLATANQALSQAEQQKDMNSSMLAQLVQNAPLVASSNPSSPVATPQADQQELTALLAKESDLTSHYTDNYPDVVQVRRKIADLRKKMAAAPVIAASGGGPTEQRHVETPEIIQLRAKVRGADTEIRNRQAEQATIQRQINEYRARIEASPLLDEKYKELTRGYETARQIYDGLLVKVQNSKEATDLERAQEAEQFTVMDGANLPEEPTFPKRWMFALGGVILGLGVGLGLAALLEYRDTVLRSEQDVWAFTRLPTLAVIAYSGALVVAQSKPSIFSRMKSLFSSKRSNDTQDPDTLNKATT